MLVDLMKIPAPLPSPSKMKLWRWGISCVIVMILGSLFTLVINHFYSLSYFWLCFGLTVAPFSIWILAFLYCLYVNGCQQYYVTQWNQCCQKRREELITFAQRPLYLLDSYLYTQYGKAGNAKFISSSKIIMESQCPHSGGNAIPHSALPLERNVSESNFTKRLSSIFFDIKSIFNEKLLKLSISRPLHICLFIDAPLTEKNILQEFNYVWKNKLNYASISIIVADKSDSFLDDWLDNKENDNALLFVIACHLFDYPKINAAEAGIALLLAGKNILMSGDLDNSIFNDDDFIEIYRTEHQENIDKLLDNTLLWGECNKSELTTIWTSNIKLETNIELFTYCNNKKITINNIFNIDTSIGNANHCAYWLTLAIAVEMAMLSKEKQLVVCGEQEISALVVSNYMPDESVKDK